MNKLNIIMTIVITVGKPVTQKRGKVNSLGSMETYLIDMKKRVSES